MDADFLFLVVVVLVFFVFVVVDFVLEEFVEGLLVLFVLSGST